MTADRQRRRRATVLGLLAAVAGLVAAGVLGVAGMRTLADSTAGRRVEGRTVTLASQRLPYTPTALVGTVDEAGRLTSTVVMAIEPDGTGGSIVELAATADAGSGATGELAPLAAVLEADGATAYLEAAERLTSLSFDVVEIVDAERFAQLVSRLGDLPAMFPVAHRDGVSGETWAAGETVLSAPGAARAVTATDPALADWYLEPARSAVWQAVADRVGAGIGSAEPVQSDDDLAAPAGLDQFLDRLFAGPVAFRSLGFRALDDDRIAEQLPDRLAETFGSSPVAVVVHDRAVLLMVFGSVAPGRLGAPLEAPSFRVVSGFGEADLEGVDQTPADVLKQAIDRLLFVKVNIVSVVDAPAAAVPDVTQIVVTDPALIDGVAETYGILFGEIEVTVAEVAIEGVDIEVRLGRSFLDQLGGDQVGEVGGQAAADVAGSDT